MLECSVSTSERCYEKRPILRKGHTGTQRSSRESVTVSLYANKQISMVNANVNELTVVDSYL